MSFLAEKKAPAACARQKKTKFFSKMTFWAKKRRQRPAHGQQKLFFQNVFFDEKKAPAACAWPNKIAMYRITSGGLNKNKYIHAHVILALAPAGRNI